MKKTCLILTIVFGSFVTVSVSQQTVKKKITKPAPVVTITTAPIAQNMEIDPGTNPGDLGKITFTYAGKKVTYVTVRAKDGNIWLQQNLGSKHVATGFDDPESLGDLFQWGRWDDSHQLVVDIPNTRRGSAEPNNPAGLDKQGKNPFYYATIATWWYDGRSTDQWTAATPAEATATNGCDPCKMIAAGWHLPTKDELAKVFALEYITNPNGAMLSNLKLTNDGYIDPYNGDILYTRGKNAVYWTSTAAPNEFGKGYAMEFKLTPGVLIRGYGASIRCMKSK